MAGVNARTHEAFYEVWDRIFQDPRIIPRTILADGVLAGGISCFQVEEIDYVGYWLAQEFWGRGIAGNALVQFLQICTRRPLRADVSTGNPASLRVLAKAGFRETSRTMEPGTERYIAGEVAHFILE